MNIISNELRIGTNCLLTALLLFGSEMQLRSEETKSATTAAASDLAKDLSGVWVLVGTPDQVGEIPKKGGRLLFLTDGHWAISQAAPETGVVVFHHGGSFTLKDDEYVETVSYANENTKDLIGQTFRFKMKVDGDTLTKIGQGNPWTEVWKRLK